MSTKETTFRRDLRIAAKVEMAKRAAGQKFDPYIVGLFEHYAEQAAEHHMKNH